MQGPDKSFHPRTTAMPLGKHIQRLPFSGYSIGLSTPLVFPGYAAGMSQVQA